VLVGRGSPERGGIPTFLATLLDSPLAQQVDLRLLNLARPDVRDGGRASAGNVVRAVQDATALWRVLMRRDVVHLNTALAPSVTLVRTGLFVLVARLRGARVLVHVHGGLVALWMTTARRRRLTALCLAGAARIAVVAQGTRDAVARACGASRVVLVDNAVNLASYTGPLGLSTPPRVLFAGGLTPRKGVGDLLEASRRLHDSGVDHELWLAGGTPDEGASAEAAVRALAGPGVRFLGPLPPEQMPSLYRSVDVFCLPSWYEAMPLSVLEAMAAGLPVVATDVGDVRRALVDGVTGCLVPPRSPELLAAALRELLVAPPEVRRARGSAGRRRVEERFSLDVLVRRTAELYDELGATK
jgi:glycosyltransferase involved in cell wall biosynthesis